MQDSYDARLIEQRQQAIWREQQTFKAVEDSDAEKFYCLAMFPYPSGKLHMGHVRNYTIADVISRYQRLLGKNVLHPMGWDAFGLPAENAAIKHNTAPAEWTAANIETMREQLKSIGFSYDWSREFATNDPQYYRWEQWFFSKLYDRGLIYKKEAEVNWDPVDQTVLANEQVIDGRGWRSGAVVERKLVSQWFVKITDYAEELLRGLDQLEGWPESVKTMQRNWIGKSSGCQLRFALSDDEDIEVYTTRADTLMGVTYLALAAQHPLAQKIAANNQEVADFCHQCSASSTAEAEFETMEKKGIPLGVNARHPISEKEVPVWCANFVLTSYGTGAVMAVPAHDQRDFEFAKKFDLPIQAVIEPNDGSSVDADKAFTEYGRLVNSGEFNGLSSEQAIDAITDCLRQGKRGERRIQYRIRDWGVSRQRYWGCPIPIVYNKDGTPQPESEFPVVLPTEVDMSVAGTPLRDDKEFFELPNGCTRETDTFDTFFESSWYYARFCCPDADSVMLDHRANYWLPVDQYVGGIEHAVMHLLYARFFHRLMRDVGLLDSDEPFTRLLTQGMVTARTYYRENSAGSKEYFNATEIQIRLEDDVERAYLKVDGTEVTIGHVEKMSKSKNNGVDPESIIDRYGADTVRLFTMFASPPDQSLEWNDDAIAGGARFLTRLWKWFKAHEERLKRSGLKQSDALSTDNSAVKELRFVTHSLIKRVQYNYGRQQYNTVIAAAMELTNAAEKADWQAMGVLADQVCSEVAYVLLKMLAPITPHVCESLWAEFCPEQAFFASGWIVLDETALQQDQQHYVVQVNGKLRGEITVDISLDRAQIEQHALNNENVQRFLHNKTVKKIILVPSKLVNIVAVG